MIDKHMLDATERAIGKLLAEGKRLKVEVDACHAALRTLLGAIPDCCCGDCTVCDLEYEIGIAKNILNT